MVVEQAVLTKSDELNQSVDLAPAPTRDQTQNEFTHPVENDLDPVKEEAPQPRFEGLIHVGQRGFLTDNQSIGRITNLIPGAAGQVSYLVIRTARFWGHYKIVPIELVSEVKPEGLWLSIDDTKFKELSNYKTDESIADQIERALWMDEMLRVTDYHEISVKVKNGVVSITGHITGGMHQQRIESAVGSVKGILGMNIHLVEDDKLLLKVAEVLIPIQRFDGNQVFAKVENGVVGLSGKVINADDRGLAEQLAGNVPLVRGVMNYIAAPGMDSEAEGQPFFQPSIGAKIFFSDGLFGFVRQVVINPKNRRVVAMILQGQFPVQQQNSGSIPSYETQTPERLVAIPMSVIRYLTSYSGFLLIDSTETTQYQDFDPASFAAPDADWVPPYPYSSDNVRFLAK